MSIRPMRGRTALRGHGVGVNRADPFRGRVAAGSELHSV
jgi:hypothetical protein